MVTVRVGRYWPHMLCTVCRVCNGLSSLHTTLGYKTIHKRWEMLVAKEGIRAECVLGAELLVR